VKSDVTPPPPPSSATRRRGRGKVSRRAYISRATSRFGRRVWGCTMAVGWGVRRSAVSQDARLAGRLERACRSLRNRRIVPRSAPRDRCFVWMTVNRGAASTGVLGLQPLAFSSSRGVPSSPDVHVVLYLAWISGHVPTTTVRSTSVMRVMSAAQWVRSADCALDAQCNPSDRRAHWRSLNRAIRNLFPSLPLYISARRQHERVHVPKFPELRRILLSLQTCVARGSIGMRGSGESPQ